MTETDPKETSAADPLPSAESPDGELRIGKADARVSEMHPRFVPLIVAFLTFCATYTLAYASKLPVLRYLPLDRKWTLLESQGQVTMGYYGLLVLSAIAFGVAFGVASIPPINKVLKAPAISRVLTFTAACSAFGALIYVAIAELIRL